MQTIFTIGEFAKIHNCSKQTLIFYDKIGLLKPYIKDENNGYRYYSAEQIELLDTIFILKEIGVPLQSIKEYLENRSTQNSINLLNQQKKYLQEKIQELTAIKNRLNKKLDILQSAQKLQLTNDILIKQLPAQLQVRIDFAPTNDLLIIDNATKELVNYLTDKKYPYNYQLGYIIARENIMAGDYFTHKGIFTIIDKTIDDPYFYIRPQGRYAIIYHKGPYPRTDISYEHLLQEIEKANYQICGDSYELALIDNFSTGQERDYITQIAVPIQQKPSFNNA
ncbi:MAG: MerR family transcriptional regulator [Clostridiales bacterium]